MQTDVKVYPLSVFTGARGVENTVLQFIKRLLEFDDIILIYKICPPPPSFPSPPPSSLKKDTYLPTQIFQTWSGQVKQKYF